MAKQNALIEQLSRSPNAVIIGVLFIILSFAIGVTKSVSVLLFFALMYANGCWMVSCYRRVKYQEKFGLRSTVFLISSFFAGAISVYFGLLYPVALVFVGPLVIVLIFLMRDLLLHLQNK